MRPIRLGASSVNQRPPSGPGVISAGRLLAEMPEPVEKSVILPVDGTTRPKRLARFSTNQTLPSGPAAMPSGPLPAASGGSSVMVVA